MSYYDNVYNSPEKFGLTLIDQLDLAGGYEYDTVLVFEKEGKLYWAHDSGCSCPIPFESYKSIEDLDILDWKEFEAFVDNWLNWDKSSSDEADKADLKRTVINKMKELGL